MILGFCLVLGSCGDEAPEKAKYTDGVIVVNQGAFQSGTGTLTFKGRGDATPVQDIYGLNNDGAFLGNIAQSMIEYKGRNYISINNGGKIVVTDKDDFTLLDTIGGIFQSRYFASDGDKLYVSAWGQTGVTGSVQELIPDQSMAQLAFSLGNGPEGMVFVDDLLYIARGGGFGTDSTLVIVDATNNSVVKEMTVGLNPEYMVTDNDDNVYLICNGRTNFSSPSLSTPGQLLKIKDQEIVWTIELPDGSNRLTIDRENGFLYFNMNGSVVKQSVDSEVLNAQIVHTGSAYALGFDASEDQLYIGDAKDFASQGEVFVYSSNDELLESFACGIVPSYFHFK